MPTLPRREAGPSRIHHATDHRSQIRKALSAPGIDSPDLPVWSWRNNEDARTILSELSTTQVDLTE